MNKDKYNKLYIKKKKSQKLTLRAGFEPARGDPIGFQVQRLNHSAITADAGGGVNFILITLRTKMAATMSMAAVPPAHTGIAPLPLAFIPAKI